MKDSDERAKSYWLGGLESNRRLFQHALDLVARHPEMERGVLSAIGSPSLDDCRKTLEEATTKIGTFKEAGGKLLPNRREQAKEIGPNAELTYVSVYGPVLSEEAHVGPAAVRKFLQPAVRDATDEINRALWTALGLYLDLARLGSRYLGKPAAEDLAKFDQILAESMYEVAQGTAPP